MENQTAVVESSPTETPDVFNGENVSFEEFSKFRSSGEVPERFKPAETKTEAATVQEQDQNQSEGEQSESGSESESEEQQQQEPKGKKRPTAEDRIAQLEATIEKIRRGAGIERKTEPAPVTEPEPSQPQNFAEWEKAFSPEKWIEQYGKDHPDASYERANAAMFSHMLNVREQFRDAEQRLSAQRKELDDKVNEARARYGEHYDDVMKPTVAEIVNDKGINDQIKSLIGGSKVLADLIFTIGDDAQAKADFIHMARTNPNEAIRYIVEIERGIIEELAGQGKETPRDEETGKFTAKETPAKPKTSAPKPPVPVTGASSGAFDVSDESLSPEQWMRQRNEQLAKKKG